MTMFHETLSAELKELAQQIGLNEVFQISTEDSEQFLNTLCWGPESEPPEYFWWMGYHLHKAFEQILKISEYKNKLMSSEFIEQYFGLLISNPRIPIITYINQLLPDANLQRINTGFLNENLSNFTTLAPLTLNFFELLFKELSFNYITYFTGELHDRWLLEVLTPLDKALKKTNEKYPNQLSTDLAKLGCSQLAKRYLVLLNKRQEKHNVLTQTEQILNEFLTALKHKPNGCEEKITALRHMKQIAAAHDETALVYNIASIGLDGDTLNHLPMMTLLSTFIQDAIPELEFSIAKAKALYDQKKLEFSAQRQEYRLLAIAKKRAQEIENTKYVDPEPNVETGKTLGQKRNRL